MGEKFAAFGQAHGVDTIRLENLNGAVGYGRHDEQRQKKIVAASEFGGQEYGHERRMHHPAHHSGHAYESEVLCRERRVETDQIGNVCKKEAGHTTDVERRGECTANTTCAVCGRRCKSLGKDDKGDKEYDKPHLIAVAIEQRTVDDRRRIAVEQTDYRSVTLAV